MRKVLEAKELYSKDKKIVFVFISLENGDIEMHWEQLWIHEKQIRYKYKSYSIKYWIFNLTVVIVKRERYHKSVIQSIFWSKSIDDDVWEKKANNDDPPVQSW